MWMVVLFPAPLGPSSPRISPRRTSSERPSTATRSPNRLWRSRRASTRASYGAAGSGQRRPGRSCRFVNGRRERPPVGYIRKRSMTDTSPRIMVVDDLVDHRELLSQVLVDLGYTVDTVGDARHGARRDPATARGRSSSWSTSGCRAWAGTTSWRALRAEPDPELARIPVVVMTADPDGVAELLAGTPPDFLLEKPFGLRELRRVVVRFCGQGAAPHRWGAPVDSRAGVARGPVHQPSRQLPQRARCSARATPRAAASSRPWVP